jgi:hypothetical protein
MEASDQNFDGWGIAVHEEERPVREPLPKIACCRLSGTEVAEVQPHTGHVALVNDRRVPDL